LYDIMTPELEGGAMSKTVCLDGVKIDLDVERVDVDFHIPTLAPACPDGTGWGRCEAGEAMEPIACFEDGTVIYFHCPPEGEPCVPGYHVSSRRPHQWQIDLAGAPRVARLHVALA